MNTQVKQVGWWAVRKHPKETLHAARFAARHRRLITRVILTVRASPAVAQHARRGATNPKSRAEMKRAASDLNAALARARKVGMASALRDERFATQLRRASKHASKAAAAAKQPEGRHAGRTVAALVAAGLVGGSLYAGLKGRS